MVKVSDKKRSKKLKVGNYEKHRRNMAERVKAESISGRDIANELHKELLILKPKRRKSCERNFRSFCEEYFPETFSLEWSDDHLKVIAKIEQSVLHGGLFAMAMPRGSGKSTLAETACIWGMLYGHREFVALICATEETAEEMLDSIKTELSINPLLLEDFRLEIYPVIALDGIANRCSGQLYKGKRTHITWNAREIVLPTIEGSTASGAIIRVAGLTGRIRGMKFKRPDSARTVRPSLVIIDDPQTRESAESLEQTRKRVRILAGDVLGLAGPGKKISGIMPCTVIRAEDLSDQMLSREKHPDWNGERTKMLYSFPVNIALWEKYGEIRAESFRLHGDISEATEFYIQNRKKMDEGAIIAWTDRYNHDEVSAIQHAMNLKFQDSYAFSAEYQNEPEMESFSEDIMTPEIIASRNNGYPRCIVPATCTTVTNGVDVQKKIILYTIWAFDESGRAYLIENNTIPKQPSKFFTAANPPVTLEDYYKCTFEEAIQKGLEDFIDNVHLKNFKTSIGNLILPSHTFCDSGYKSDIVYRVKRMRQLANFDPSKGIGITASKKPIEKFIKKRGEKYGWHWYYPNVRGTHEYPYCAIDVNWFKSLINSGVLKAESAPGSVSFWGDKTVHHEMIIDHFTAETFTETRGQGRIVDEWKMKPSRRENHFFDCSVYAFAAASASGIKFPEQDGSGNKPLVIPRAERKYMKLSEIQKQKRGTHETIY